MDLDRSPLVACTALPGADGGPASAAALAVAAARRPGAPPAGIVMAQLAAGVKRRPTLVSSAAARALEATLRGELPAAARGALCWVGLDPAEGWREELALCRAAGADAVVVYSEPAAWRELIDEMDADAAVLRAELPSDRALAALAAIELIRAGLPTGVLPRAPGLVASRRALAGIDPGGELSRRTGRLASRLLAGPGRCAIDRSPRPDRPGPARVRAGEAGQALPLLLGMALLTVVAGLLVALLGAAASGASRFQRAADLGAISAARSMQDDYARLFAPATLPGGAPNPAHLTQAEFEGRARAAAEEGVAANGAGEAGVEVTFPQPGFAPTRVRVELGGSPALDGRPAGGGEVEVVAMAEIHPVATTGGSGVAQASGGGYRGRLVNRQGEGMRPDVAAGFDRMAAAAAGAGHALIINSGFRSDAEQATLFAANPDPRMVARPGTSLHRCATELDLGPPAAYAWLAANAPRFGFTKRYAWEPWHFGFTAGPEPCSRAADTVAPPTGRGSGGAGSAGATGRAGRRGDGGGSRASLPAFVPARFREPIARAASRWNVLASVLAAQLLAESGFNPLAVSPAGASGIAQFMPGTAAAYGLRDPLDPGASINAQAHLMSDLIGQFGQLPLALAAYNAGPSPVAACGCVPAYPETQAYVARILGLLGGVGAAAPPELEVRLVG